MPNPRIVALGTANPTTQFSQEELLALASYTDERRRGFFLHSGIEQRHLYVDKATFRPTETTDELSDRFRKGGVEIGSLAIQRALETSGCSAQEIDFIATTTCTGRLCPNLDAHFVREFRMKEGVQRVHVGDMGCASGMIALQQAYNHLRAFPDHRALIVSVEICSSTYYLDDSLETAVANAIFADGSAAALLASDRDGIKVMGHMSLVRSEHLDLMGFTYPNGRPRILLSKEIRGIGSAMMKGLAEAMLDRYHLKQEEIRFWVLHSAGRGVLERTQREMGLGDADLRFSRQVLRQFGNMSSATVLFVLNEVIRSGQASPGDLGVMIALGPGFCAEGALLRW
ncbi:MAG: type III polyketide synthase [candidate division NC10 bacterium]|nr:type III polyketide synthase [candidate division NC10 bacterium]MDE2321568.1 type III polyketide synthase [candidate division NC10 bacterium]